MKTIYLVRHGETIYTEEKKVQGRTDVGLSDLGRQTARRLGEFLSSFAIDEIYMSPLSRAVETARIINGILQLPAPTTRQELMERDLGIFEGSRHDSDGYDLLRVSFNSGDMAFRPLGGESYQDVVYRIKPFTDYLLQKLASKVLIVGHAGVNKVVMGILLDRVQEVYIHCNPQHNEVYEIDITGKQMQIHKV